MKYPVLISQCNDYSPESLRLALEKVLTPQFKSHEIHGKSVMIKPNLLAWRHANDIASVHPALIVETVKVLLDHGASKVAIRENPGVQTAPSILHAMGIADELKNLGVDFANFSDYRPADCIEGLKNCKMELAHEYQGYDYVLNLAKAKTHAMMTLTLCTKNLFGFVNGADRFAWHLSVGRDYAKFADVLLDLYLLIRPQFNVLDAIICMEGNGPGNGTATDRRLLFGAEDALDLDTVAASMLGAPDLILLKVAKQRGLITETPLPKDLPPCQPLELPTDEKFEISHARLGVGIPPFIQNWLHEKFLSRPKLNATDCISCGLCARVCPPKAIDFSSKRPDFNLKKCIRCFCCQEHCPKGAIVRQKSFLARFVQWLGSKR